MGFEGKTNLAAKVLRQAW